MSIKVISKEEKTPAIKTFPKLMQNDEGDIVYFIRPKCGLPLTGRGWNYTNMNADNWNMEIFTDYTETLTIKND